MDDHVSFGRWLRAARVLRGFRQVELAKRLGYAPITLRKWEANEARPSIEAAEALAQTFEIDVEYRHAFILFARRGTAQGHTPFPTTLPPPPSLVSHPSQRSPSWPTPVTPFVGQETPLDELQTLLRAPRARLVTLTGTAGIGKTRLALEVAGRLANEFEAGISFVNLVAITRPESVLAAIAQATQMPSLQRKDAAEILQGLKDHLRHQHALLVLDNFEQVLDAAPLVADLLRYAPKLRVLVTSRSVLHVYGERPFAVPPLSVPDDIDQPRPAQDWLHYDGVRLFVERGRDIQPEFALTEANARSIALIARQLDGVPLAIELAAKRLRILSPEAILERLTHRMQLLATSDVDTPNRHKTLRNAIAWSHDLLSADEKALFRQLSVFAGGFTLDAAQSVWHGEGHHSDDILDAITSLIDQSLVTTQWHEDGGAPRFTMLEMIREYADEQLAASGEEEVVRERHATYYLALAEHAQPFLTGSEQARWLTLLGAELPNLRVALEWFAHDAQPDRSLQLASALLWVWAMRGLMSEGARWLAQALARETGETGGIVRARALHSLGLLAFWLGDWPASAAYLEDSVAIFRLTHQKKETAVALNALGLTLTELGEYERATLLYEESLKIAQEIGEARMVASVHSALGVLAVSQADHGAAQSHFEASIAIKHGLDDRMGTTGPLVWLGWIALHRSDYDAARAYFTLSLERRREFQDEFGLPASLEGFASLALAQSHPEQAARLMGAAEALRRRMLTQMPRSERAEHEVTRRAAQQHLGEKRFAVAWREGLSMTRDEAICCAFGEIDATYLEGEPRGEQDTATGSLA